MQITFVDLEINISGNLLHISKEFTGPDIFYTANFNRINKAIFIYQEALHDPHHQKTTKTLRTANHSAWHNPVSLV